MKLRPTTFSIVAYDPEARAWGVAVQSKFIAVGAVVCFAEGGVGAVATQSFANTRYGPLGLTMMRHGLPAEETIAALVAGDPGREHRQVGVVDSQGRAAAYTGSDCYAWAGHVVGEHFACQGNILVGPRVVESMAEAFGRTSGPLAGRLLGALEAGQAAGGDRRGQQSAALLVVAPGGGYAGFNDRLVDLRVDDDPAPIARLHQLYDLHQVFFGQTRAEDLVPLDGTIQAELQRIAAAAGHYQGPPHREWDDATRRAVDALIGAENLEDRWRTDGQFDMAILRYLHNLYGKSTDAELPDTPRL